MKIILYNISLTLLLVSCGSNSKETENDSNVSAHKIIKVDTSHYDETYKHHRYYSKVGTIKDIDGNEYDLIEIGKQVWLAQNLRVKRFRNGDEIYHAKTAGDWVDATIMEKPAWCYYNFDSKNEKYGLYYNWNAVTDKRGLAPVGCDIPLKGTWYDLEDQLAEDGYDSDRGCALKSLDMWDESKLSSNAFRKRKYDIYGFEALPLGYISLEQMPIVGEELKAFYGFTEHFNVWTGDEKDYNEAWAIRISVNQNGIGVQGYEKHIGMPIRLTQSIAIEN